MQNRIKRLRDLLANEGIDAFLIVRPENRYYLTGFTGSTGAVLINEKEICLITDFRYDEQARAQSPHCNVITVKETLMEAMGEMANKWDIRVLGCEGDFITYFQYNTLKEKYHGRVVRPLDGFVESLRIIKDESEINRVSEAVRLSDMAFDYILPFIREGVSEREIALEIEFFMRKKGAGGVPFLLIVASGHRSSMPHGTASEKKLAHGDLVTLDFGATLEGYNSDITRTVVVGEADARKEDIYHIVLEAQLRGIGAVKPGTTASEVDRAVRDVIEKHGYGDYFGHSTGHGLGLQIHESPRLSAKDHTELKPGMVITVEPGIYLPGWGGVRIEDTVVVGDKGCRVLTASIKDKMIVCGR